MQLVQLNLFPASILTQLVLLTLAFVLSAVIGVERQHRLKSAGMRTHTLVGIGAAVFTLVSAFGFSSVIGQDVVLDPSRIAAQIVSGIGFLGAGVIFVRQNAVNGLTTAASIWVTAAVGMACGAGMVLIAVAATIFYVLGVSALPLLNWMIPTADKHQIFFIQYKENRGALRAILSSSTLLGYEASLAKTRRIETPGKATRVEARLKFTSQKPRPVDDLVEALTDVKGVVSVNVSREEND